MDIVQHTLRKLHLHTASLDGIARSFKANSCTIRTDYSFNPCTLFPLYACQLARIILLDIRSMTLDAKVDRVTAVTDRGPALYLTQAVCRAQLACSPLPSPSQLAMVALLNSPQPVFKQPPIAEIPDAEEDKPVPGIALVSLLLVAHRFSY